MENYDVTENPILAAGNPYAGKNSAFERSWRARRQLRDSKGRWVYMGGNLGIKLKLPNGKNIRVYGKNVGASDAKDGYAQVYIHGQADNGIPDGFYLVKADKGRIYKAVLTPEQLKEQGINLQDVSDLDPELQQLADIEAIDAPEGWNLRADGSYKTSDGDWAISKNEDGKWEVTQDEIPLGAYDNLGDAFADVADRDAEALLSDEEKAKVTELRAQQDKLNEDFSKTTNPEAMARIEGKLEVLDGGIKDIIRNKPADTPAADVTPEADQVAPEDVLAADFYTEDTKEMQNAVEMAPIGTIFKVPSPHVAYEVYNGPDSKWEEDYNVPIEAIKGMDGKLYSYDESDQYFGWGGEITPKEMQDLGFMEVDKLGDGPAPSKAEASDWTVAETDENGNKTYQSPDGSMSVKETPYWTNSYVYSVVGADPKDKKSHHLSWIGVQKKFEEQQAATPVEPTPAEPAPEAPQVTEVPSAPQGPKNLDEYKLIDGAKGSNKGGVYQGPDGDKVYVKFQDEAHAKNEILAAKLYDAAGVPAADVLEGTLNGENVTYSPMVDSQGSLANNLKNEEFMAALQDGFAVDAWLANWDVAGLNFDNVLADEFGMPFRVDGGGALQFRAQGSPKGDAFGSKANEIDTLVDSGLNPQSAQVFGPMTDAQKAESANLVEAVSDATIDDVVKSVYGDTPEATDLAQKLKDRKADVIARLKPTREAAPEAAPETPVSEDFKKANTPLGQDLADWEKELLGLVEPTPETPAAETPAVNMPDTNAGYIEWEDWAFKAPGGTTVYHYNPEGVEYKWVKHEQGGWDLFKGDSTESFMELPSGAIASQGTQGLVHDAPTGDITPQETAGLAEQDISIDNILVNQLDEGTGSIITDNNTGEDVATILLDNAGGYNATFMPYNADEAAMAVFKTKADAEGWLGDQVATKFNLETNPYNGAQAGSFTDKVTVHKKNFLNAPSSAQTEALKEYSLSKQLTPEDQAEVDYLLAKENPVAGEVGAMIGKLKKLPNIEKAEKKPRDGGTADVPVVDTPGANAKSAQDVLDANIIWEQIKTDHPEHQQLSVSDLRLVERVYTDGNGNKFNYEVIVRRTPTERFFAYVRETDMQTGEVRVMKATNEHHSYKAIANKMANAKFHVASDINPRLWMQKAKKPIYKVPAGVDVTQYNDNYTAEFSFAKTDSENKNKLIDVVTQLIDSPNLSKDVLEAMAKVEGVDQSFVDEIHNAVIEHQFKQTAGAGVLKSDYPTTPYVSYDGVTEVKAGDYVDWTDNKVGSSTYGQVFRGIVQNRLNLKESKKYGYTDGVLVIFPEYNKAHGYPPSHQRDRTAPALKVVAKDAPLSEPFQQKAKEKADQDKIVKLNSDHPTVAEGEKASVMPKPKTKAEAPHPIETNIDTEGNAYVGETVVPNSTADTAEMAAASGNLSIPATQLQNGDIIYITPNGETSQVGAVVIGTKMEDGLFAIDYSYIGSGGIPKGGKLVLTDTEAQTVKMSVLRPAQSKFSPITEDKAQPAWKSDPATDKQKMFISKLIKQKQIPDDTMAKLGQLTSNLDATKGEYSDMINTLSNFKDKKSVDANPEATTADTVGTADNLVSAIDGAAGGDAVDTQSITDAASAASLNENQNTPAVTAYGNSVVQPIAFEDIKYGANVKSHRFVNNKAVKVEDLKPGDLIPQGSSDWTWYMQVLDVDDDPDYKNRKVITYRTVSKNPDKNGQVQTVTWWNSMSAKRVKTPKNIPANDGYVVTTAGGAKDSGNPIESVDSPGLSKVDNLEAITSQGSTPLSSDFMSQFDVPSELADGVTIQSIVGYMGSQENLYKTASTDYVIRIGANKSGVALPGSVVTSQDKGSAGIVKSYNKDLDVVEVAWLSGAKSGTTEKLQTTNIRDAKSWVTADKAKEFGVEVDSTVTQKIQDSINSTVASYKKTYEDKILAEQQTQAYNAMLADHTVYGAGGEVIDVPEGLTWSYKAFNGIDSMNEAVDTVNSGKAGVFGRQVLVDSDQIEDSKVRISQVIGKDGNTYTRVEFTATDWTTNGDTGITALAASADGVETSNGMQFAKYKIDSQGRLVDTGAPIKNSGSGQTIDQYQNGTTYKVPIRDVSGDIIGYYLLHRANKDSSPIKYDFTGHTSNSDLARSYHNKAEIILNENATPAQIEYALTQMGITDARPATPADVKRLAENKIINLFGKKNNGQVNYDGELRKMVLADFEKRYGFSAADAVYVQDGSDLMLLMPEEFGKKVAEETKVHNFTHSWNGPSIADGATLDERAQQLVNFILYTKLRPTSARWTHGINTKGASSSTDGYGQGAGYVYTRVNGTAYGDMSMEFNANNLLRRLDFYGNTSDMYGKQVPGTSIIDNLSSANEVLFKDTISWADLAKISIGDTALRERVLEILLQGGISTIGDKPVNEVIK